jgi:hypothetical protein
VKRKTLLLNTAECVPRRKSEVGQHSSAQVVRYLYILVIAFPDVTPLNTIKGMLKVSVINLYYRVSG